METCIRIKKRSSLLLALLCLGGCLSLSATVPRAIPLPADIVVLPPDPALPEEVRLLSGSWAGEITSVTPWQSRMIVESLQGTSARIVYAHSGHHSNPGIGSAKTARCHCAPDWGRMQGRIDHAGGATTLRFMTPTGRMSLVVNKDRPDLMEGYLVRKNGPYPVTMKRIRE